MGHKFNPEKKAKLDNPKRRMELPPEVTLQKFGLAIGNTVVDIGCGIGYFSIAAANLVGPKGKVFALDLVPEMLDEVQHRAHEAKVANVEIVQGQENQFPVADGVADMALAFFLLHEAEDLGTFLPEIKRILRAGGQLAIIDWEKKETHSGPPVAHRIAKEDLMEQLKANGFAQVEQIEVGNDYYGLLAH